MAKGRGSNDANATVRQAQQNSNVNTQNAVNLYGNLAPTLESQVAAPAGYSPRDLASMETGEQQGAGGSQAAAVGQGALLAARTGNAGAAGKSISDSSRGAGEELSRNLMGIRSANANLKEQKRGDALSGLQKLAGTQTDASTNNLGLVAPLVNANAATKNASTAAGKATFDSVMKALEFVGGKIPGLPK